ncbi:hypothetical protein FE782_14805 [Paenibacillus antri]|uniref:LPXTG cell wall anchor domain-containing protein n=1 Tax=Paenibacillus antri TaxID=2582848 RepID=A0A5R9GBB5_9BACL|nr:hypothetical protein [Paenibacillus antri]TLS51380.1 hypothetical protein FE782_14805 [Paenibacillus antri]
MKCSIRSMLLAVALLLLVPQQVGAYSYGDPNQEVIAEAMKEMIAKLPSGAPDWTAVGDIYKVHRPEIESHFGASVATTLDADIQAEDKERFLSNYKALLVLNLARRFEYANKDVKDYSAAKLLLAKAKGTYDVLQPYVADDATDAAVRTAFDEALAALGNPGLFGVGEQPVDPETFKARTDLILSKLKPLFKLQAAAAEQPTAAEPAKPTPAAPAKSEPAKTTEPAKTEPSKTTADSQKPAASEPKAEVEPAKQEEPAKTAGPEEAQPEQEATPTEAQAETEIAPAAVEEAAPEQDAAAATAETTTAAAEPAPEAAGHAPMERQSRTNPMVSVAVIGAVAIAAAGGIVYAKKRKLF